MPRTPKAKPLPRKDIVLHYVEIAKTLPFVQRILLTGDCPHCGTLLTIFDSPPFDSTFTHQIFEAEGIAIDRSEEVVDFHLLNVHELDEDLHKYLPPAYQVLYEREQVL